MHSKCARIQYIADYNLSRPDYRPLASGATTGSTIASNLDDTFRSDSPKNCLARELHTSKKKKKKKTVDQVNRS